MKTEKSIEVEIKELELSIARLELDLSKKRKQRRDLQKQQEKESIGLKREKESIGLDRYERSIQEGDTVRILTPSRSGPFKGQTHAVVVGRSRRHSGRILIGIINDLKVTTNREAHNVQVIESRDDGKSGERRRKN